ncbi:hypothetical protein Daus18300_011159 [Diaporthe australafricana]|uniref:Uncharacterized protein n=1 Tax=Diaporthe australafricana TaxID=127596 RepID=A0ABR3W7G4_9PEZI
MSRKRKFDLEDATPIGPKNLGANRKQETVRPRFWKTYTQVGKAKRRDARAKETVDELKSGYDAMLDLEGELSFNQQRHIFPYIFWPPLPRWCLVPFDISSKTIRTDEGQLNPLRYGLGQKCGDQMWKHGVLSVFQPWRQYAQIFDHLLLPVHFPWQDDSTPDGEVPMFGLVHMKRGSKTAYFHVMTEWQQDIYDEPLYNKLWAEDIVQQLTSEQGVDQGLFLGNDAIKVKFVPNRVGADWQNLGWNGPDMAELSKLTFYYIVYAATQLAVGGVHDMHIPKFGLEQTFTGLAQALLGVSTALDHADEGRKSVREGIKARVDQDAPGSLKAHRSSLDQHFARRGKGEESGKTTG